jgi:hypothetical protein
MKADTNRTDLSLSIKRVRAAAAAVNAASDQAALAVSSLEEFLNRECSAGVYASVHVRNQQDEQGDEHSESLAYGRYGTRFRVLVEFWGGDDPETATPRPWAECSRDVKLASAEKIPDLIDAIVVELNREAQSLEHVVSVVKSVTSAVKSEGGEVRP